MTTIITAIAETTHTPRPKTAPRVRLDPGLVAVVGCSAGALLALSAAAAAVNLSYAATLAIGGNSALVIFALMSLDRPYRRIWMPALLALAAVGLAGLALAMMPRLEVSFMPMAMTRLGLESVLIIAQLAAVALVAMAWSSAGRSPRRMRVSAICVGILAAMQLAQAVHGALDLDAVTPWHQAIDLVFALWLVRTAICPLRPRKRARLA